MLFEVFSIRMVRSNAESSLKTIQTLSIIIIMAELDIHLPTRSSGTVIWIIYQTLK